MTPDGNDAPSRTRRHRGLCIAFPSGMPCTLPFGALGYMGKRHIGVPSKPMAYIVDYACPVQRTLGRGVKWSGKDLFLAGGGCATPRIVSAEKDQSVIGVAFFLQTAKPKV